ncbi:hypothetical protein N7523_005698 [Penicillium sp. IBT 18751x]|nr:hypothetical protein N7523_005698 [Penicillium sp. IBT 18751x]
MGSSCGMIETGGRDIVHGRPPVARRLKILLSWSVVTSWGSSVVLGLRSGDRSIVSRPALPSHRGSFWVVGSSSHHSFVVRGLWAAPKARLPASIRLASARMDDTASEPPRTKPWSVPPASKNVMLTGHRGRVSVVSMLLVSSPVVILVAMTQRSPNSDRLKNLANCARQHGELYGIVKFLERNEYQIRHCSQALRCPSCLPFHHRPAAA